MMWTSLPLMGIQRIEGYDRITFQWWWVIAAVAVLMIVLATWKVAVLVLGWWSKPSDNPKRLFRNLVRIHKLSTSERRLLNRLALKLPKNTPEAVLFVDPTFWPLDQTQELDKKEQLRELFYKLFGKEVV
jgi:hypothetical protein